MFMHSTWAAGPKYTATLAQAVALPNLFKKNIMVNVCKPFYNWQTKGQPKLGDYLHFG